MRSAANMTDLRYMDTKVLPGDLKGFTPLNGVQVSDYDIDTTEEWVFIGFDEKSDGITVIYAGVVGHSYNYNEWTEYDSLTVQTMADAVAAVDLLCPAPIRRAA